MSTAFRTGSSPLLEMGRKSPASYPKAVVCHIYQQKPQKTVTELFPAVSLLLKQELQESPWRVDFIPLYEAGDQARQGRMAAEKVSKIDGQNLHLPFSSWVGHGVGNPMWDHFQVAGDLWACPPGSLHPWVHGGTPPSSFVPLSTAALGNCCLLGSTSSSLFGFILLGWSGTSSWDLLDRALLVYKVLALLVQKEQELSVFGNAPMNAACGERLLHAPAALGASRHSVFSFPSMGSSSPMACNATYLLAAQLPRQPQWVLRAAVCRDFTCTCQADASISELAAARRTAESQEQFTINTIFWERAFSTRSLFSKVAELFLIIIAENESHLQLCRHMWLQWAQKTVLGHCPMGTHCLWQRWNESSGYFAPLKNRFSSF